MAILGIAAYLLPSSKSTIEASQADFNKSLVWPYDEMMQIYNKACELFQLPNNNAQGEMPLVGDLFLLRSVPELEGNIDALPPQVHLVGACLWELPQTDTELVSWLEESVTSNKPTIYIQPGKFLNSFWSHLVPLLKEQPLRVVTATGRMNFEVGIVPSNFFVRNHIPQATVLRYTRAVISSGHTTSVLGALTHGLPSLLFPAKNGTDEIAQRCLRAGAAICLSPSAVTFKTIKQAIQELLSSIELQESAQSLQSAFQRINGFERAANLLEVLAVSRKPVLRETISKSSSLFREATVSC